MSTTHDYSIDETIAAFVTLCNQYSKGCLQSMPGFFQNWTNYAWVTAKYKANYTSLIEPYKLGKISEREFLDNLAKIFYFMKDMSVDKRDALFISAWNDSIKMSEKTQYRLTHLVEAAKTQPVYLVANTNGLNAQAILALYKKHNPELQFNDVDLKGTGSKEPIQILPNVYLCLSYRCGTFKTDALIEDLSKKCSDPVTLVSQYPADLEKGRNLKFAQVFHADDFYPAPLSELQRKMQ